MTSDFTVRMLKTFIANFRAIKLFDDNSIFSQLP